MGKEGLRTALSKQATWPNALGQEVLGGPRRCGRMRAGPSGVQLLGSKQASPTRDADARMCSPRQVPPVRCEGDSLARACPFSASTAPPCVLSCSQDCPPPLKAALAVTCRELTVCPACMLIVNDKGRKPYEASKTGLTHLHPPEHFCSGEVQLFPALI